MFGKFLTTLFNDRVSASKDEEAGKRVPEAAQPKLVKVKNAFTKNNRGLKAFLSSPRAKLHNLVDASTPGRETSGVTALEETVEGENLDAGSDSDSESISDSGLERLSPIIFASVPKLSDSTSELLSSPEPIPITPPATHTPCDVTSSQPALLHTNDPEFSASQYSTKFAVPQECLLKSRFSDDSSVHDFARLHITDPEHFPSSQCFPGPAVPLKSRFSAYSSVHGSVVEIPPRLTNAFQADIPSRTHSAKSVESLSQSFGTNGLGLTNIAGFHSALFNISPVAPVEAPGEAQIKTIHPGGADVDGASRDLSFHELSSRKLKFEGCDGKRFRLEFSAGIMPSSKGNPITYDYVDETGNRRINETETISRCPTVRVSVRKYVEEETEPYGYYFYYTPNSLLGMGGFGCAVLYERRECRAARTLEYQEVADLVSKFLVVKFTLDSEDRNEIESEIRIMKALCDCPWTIQYLRDDPDIAESAGGIPSGITMPFYRATLDRFLAEVPRPALDDVRIRLLAQLVVAVNAIHEKNIAHFDLKPENIFISNTGHIVIGDLGLSQSVGPKGKLDSRNVGGTRHYQAPEIKNEEVCSQAADWYSVGVIAYQILSGVLDHPFEDSEVNGNPVIKPLHDLMYPEGDFVMKLLRRNPDKRLTSFGKMTRHTVFEEDGIMIDWDEVKDRRGNERVRYLLATYFNEF